MGEGILARVVVQAYHQALAMLFQMPQKMLHKRQYKILSVRGSKVMKEQEARQILGVTEETPWEEVLKKYDSLFENNAKNGSFYLQFKVQRAKDCLEAVLQGKSGGNPS